MGSESSRDWISGGTIATSGASHGIHVIEHGGLGALGLVGLLLLGSVGEELGDLWTHRVRQQLYLSRQAPRATQALQTTNM